MTAFGSAEGQTVAGTLRIELRSVNHRFLEIALKLPEELRSFEPAIRELLSRRIARGKLELSARLRSDPERSGALRLNPALADQLLRLIEELTRRNNRLEAGSAMALLSWPGVIAAAEVDSEALASETLVVLGQAVDALEADREREGHRLAAILHERVRALRELRAAAIELVPQVQSTLRAKLDARIAELGTAVDPQRLEQELVLLLQKMDVEEELDRLGVHLEEIARTLSRQEPVGRRLEFLIQELHREANTFGSKSSDVRTSQLAVEMKVLIEQLREQVQNLE
jgi:uncharacterized protein (TIGR00255 family)